MPNAKGLRQAGYYDCAGGGQVVVDDGIAYIAHMKAPHGTSVVDVRDPKNPKLLASLEMPPGTHSHKVRVANGIMIVNHELNRVDTSPVPAGWQGGIGIWDVSTPSKPREITRWSTSAGTGVHRFDFDGRYCYMSPTLRRLRRQHHDDHGPEGPRQADRGRPLVDAGPARRGRREARLGQDRAPLPSSAAPAATGSTPATGWPAS